MPFFLGRYKIVENQKGFSQKQHKYYFFNYKRDKWKKYIEAIIQQLDILDE